MKKLKRLLATVLALCCILACFDTTVFASDNTAWYSSRVGQRLADFNNYGYSSSYNTSSKGQCVWYVRGRAYEKLGVNTGLNGNGNAWYNNAIKAGLSTGYEVRSNSIACFNGGTYGHVIFVEWVDGDTVYYTEANKTADNVVSSDDGVLTKSTISGLRSRLSGSYQGCIYLTSSSPSPSYEIDSRYPTPFKAFTLQLWNTSNGKTPVYTSVGGTTAKDYIYNGYNNNDDECTIHEIYTNGWCKITVPGIDGYRYCETSVFLYDTSYVPNDQYLLESAQGYRRSDMSQTYKWCDKPNNSKWFLRVGKTGPDGYTQIIYWIEGEGHYLMWIKHNGSAIDGLNVGSDFYAYIINSEQWRHVTNEIIGDNSNVTLRKCEETERQIWKFEYQGDGYYKITSCETGWVLEVQGAVDANGTNVKTWTWNGGGNELWMLCGRWGGEITLEPKCSTRVLDVADNSTAEGANMQIWEYNKTGAQLFSIWSDPEFAINYYGNGGTNVPKAHSAQYMSSVNLSSSIPTGKSFTITYDASGGSSSATTKTVSQSFKNWNTNSDGSGTAYASGAKYTVRGATHLYAQWNSAKAGTLATATRANYNFDGWYTAASGGSKVTSTSVISANTTLYAHWLHVCANGHSYTYKATKNPTVSATGTLTGTCSKCSGTTTVTLPKLNTTDYTKTTTKAATCEETGTDKYTWKTTTYGTFSFNVTTPAKGHTEVIDKAVAPTCTATGLTEGKHCSVCDAVIKAQTTVAALGHDYVSKVTPPTCTAQGYTTYTCSRCSNSYKDNYTNPTVHNYTYKATKNPTTSATGTLTGTCSKCTGTTTVTLPKLNATDYTYKITKAATCTATGTGRYTWKTTTYGNFYFDVTIAKNPHDYKATVTAPTCTAQGYTTHTCTVCGDSYKDTYTAALGHNYSYKVTTTPTTSATGKLTGTCSRCSSTTTVALPKLNTTDYTYKVTKAATCTATGTGRYTWNTTAYGSFYFDVTIAKNPHDYKAVVTNPTCEAQGYTTHTCTKCQDSYKDSYTDALGHNYNYKVTTKPTTSAGGKLTGTCSRCSGTTTVTLPTLNTTDYTYKVTKEATCTATGTGRYTWKTTTYGSFYFDVTIAKYSHDYKVTVTAPTCTAQGYTTHKCSVCGDSYEDTYTAALGHNYSYKVTTTPTTAAIGKLTGTCSRCSDTTTVTLPKLNTTDYTYKVTKEATCTATGTGRYTWKTTTYGSFYFDVTIAKYSHDYKVTVTAPTCTAQGYTTHKCSVCGDSYEDTYTAALGHNYSYKVTTTPTTAAIGKLTGTCSRCSGTTTVTLPKLNTTDYTYKVTKEATCTATGTGRYTWKTTTYGSFYFDVTIAKIPHDYKATVTAPTCDAQGYTTYTCSRCSDSYKDSYTNASGHSYTYKATKNPTTSATGTLTGTCSRCSGTTTVTLPKLNTTDYSYSVVNTATCTATGTGRYTWKTTTYGSFYFDVTIAKIPHDYKATVTAPTCTEQGYTTCKCSVCGDSYVDGYVAALGHAESDWIVDFNATCTASGSKHTQCTRCGVTIQTSIISATGHNESEWIVDRNATCTASGSKHTECLNCGATLKTESIPAIGHIYQEIETVPTCTERGYITYICSNCNDSYVDSYIDALGHEWDEGSISQAPTCIQTGIKVFNCYRCSATKTETVAATGHSYAEIVIAPTCTDEGYITHTCGNCGDSFADSYTDALGHDWNAGTVTTEPTETETGIRTYTCERCAETKTEEIPVLGHTHNYETSVVAPTCTEEGYTIYFCACGDEYNTDRVAALGHAWNEGAVTTEPTETETGIRTYTCERCAETKTEEIPAIGHTHSYTESVIAPTCTEQGYTVNTCACGGSYTEDYVAAFGHHWDDGVITTSPTATQTGVKTYTCTRCGETKTEAIPATGTSASCNGGASCPSKRFKDVKASDWFHLSVDFAVSHGLFGGMSDTTFAPNTAMTRAMLVTVLWRYADKPNEGTNSFTDVKSGQWYTDAVVWAADNGVVTGVGNNKFNPNGNITREQMAAILYRYANANGINTSASVSLNSFPDGNKVSAYAKDAICWAVAEGLINGSDGKLMPQGNATRAQVAAILMRFIQNVAG